MRIDVVTLFPRMFDSPLSESMLRVAREKGAIEIRVVVVRDRAPGLSAVHATGGVPGPARPRGAPVGGSRPHRALAAPGGLPADGDAAARPLDATAAVRRGAGVVPGAHRGGDRPRVDRLGDRPM